MTAPAPNARFLQRFSDVARRDIATLMPCHASAKPAAAFTPIVDVILRFTSRAADERFTAVASPSVPLSRCVLFVFRATVAVLR